MAGLNKVTLIGNLGADPDIRTTQSGQKCCTLSVATSESWKDKESGEKKERTEWHRVVIWSQGLVSICEQYLKKGSKVYVEGQLQTRKWQDQTGNDRWSTEVVLNGFSASIIMLGETTGGGGNRPPNADGPEDYGQHGEMEKELDDEIPF